MGEHPFDDEMILNKSKNKNKVIIFKGAIFQDMVKGKEDLQAQFPAKGLWAVGMEGQLRVMVS